MRFCVVIPAYNEAAKIRDVVARTLAVCDRIIVVNDGSVDGTAEKLDGLNVTIVQHVTNRGKAAALWSGFKRALADGAEAVITLDGDGQHRPEDIPRFLAAAEQYPGEIIIGSRTTERDAFPKERYYANCTASFWISWAAGYRIQDSQSGFRLYPASLLRRVRVPHDRAHGFVFESEILIEAARAGIGSVALPIAAIYTDRARPSHFRSIVDVLRITRMVAWKLISRAMYPHGLWRALRSQPRIAAGVYSDPGAAYHPVRAFRSKRDTGPARLTKKIAGGKEQ